ncbi:patatin-like phospholipase family protein [Nocardia pseudobrasiliensis]|uniref:Putative patatin/cPLA2 family phospholipase n=1 Tax=Nocardia pseudobrasiliensis TaxID=45979 RepID=A0A370I8M8_9NOCA|nr:patatin family protein [Nocardia pseudobrasiliensis]RDI66960.1 putative patatin/cPLA2 family phospholipase [Nocardia pseudobrasiliensis]
METSSVGALIARRHASGSGPGDRDDDARLALVIEGGSARGAYSHGMVMALEDLGILHCFDAVYGSSAGALNGAWLLCGRANQARRAWQADVVRRVISPARALRGGRVVDTRYLVHAVYERIVPMDFPAILANPVTFHPIATAIADGNAVDLHPHLTDVASLQRALRASTCLPILAGRPTTLAGHRYVDAGLSEGVPIRTALAQGATHALVLRTRRLDEPATPPSDLELRIVTRFLTRHAPGVIDSWRTRATRHIEDEQTLTAPTILQIRPPLGSPTIGRVSRNESTLMQALDLGRTAVHRALATYLPKPLAG